MMKAPVLTDKNQFPTTETIFSHLGKNKSLWISVFGYIIANHSELREQWNYYNDGKSWLMKVSAKNKTVCWISVIEDSFRMTFYLNGNAEQAVLKSRIPVELKHQYQTGRKSKKVIGLTIIFKTKKDVETAKKLIALKLALN